MPTSRYTLYIDNISSITKSVDIRHEMERAGKVLEVRVCVLRSAARSVQRAARARSVC